MKSVLKRRKHRKGVRPLRKGMLKVRMVTLPTKDQHTSRIDELFDIALKATRDPKFKPRINMTYGELWATQRHGAMLDAVAHQIKLMQQGYDFFRNFEQIRLVDLAEPAISQYDPIFSKVETPCDTCLLKRYRSCPFDSWGNKADICTQLQAAPTLKVKTTSEMAELALTHLS